MDEASITKELCLFPSITLSFLRLMDVCFARGIIVVVAAPSFDIIPAYLRKDGRIHGCFWT